MEKNRSRLGQFGVPGCRKTGKGALCDSAPSLFTITSATNPVYLEAQLQAELNLARPVSDYRVG